MEIRYLENLLIESKRIFSDFKKENLLNSVTLREMFTPEYTYKGKKTDTYLVKSLKTGRPVAIRFVHNTFKNRDDIKEYTTYNHYFFDKSKTALGYKYFYIKNDIENSCKEMLTGYMQVSANDLYKGIGVRLDEKQIDVALKNGLSFVPRSSLGSATLYHTKMGFLPVTNDIMEVKSEFDVNRYISGLKRGSADLKLKNLKPILMKNYGRYFIDINKTQAVANVAEIKDRISEGYSVFDLTFLDLDSVEMRLSGVELNFWKNLIYKVKQNKKPSNEG